MHFILFRKRERRRAGIWNEAGKESLSRRDQIPTSIKTIKGRVIQQEERKGLTARKRKRESERKGQKKEAKNLEL